MTNIKPSEVSQILRQQLEGVKTAIDVEEVEYYLTKTWTDGDSALTTCTTGYHTASLWEIIDVSNLQYDTTLGLTLTDSGSGPPATYYGWVRTGSLSGNSTTPGQGNCNAWTSKSGSHYGTTVALADDWTAAGVLVAPWGAFVYKCDTELHVWCMED